MGAFVEIPSHLNLQQNFQNPTGDVIAEVPEFLDLKNNVKLEVQDTMGTGMPKLDFETQARDSKESIQNETGTVHHNYPAGKKQKSNLKRVIQSVALSVALLTPSISEGSKYINKLTTISQNDTYLCQGSDGTYKHFGGISIQCKKNKPVKCTHGKINSRTLWGMLGNQTRVPNIHNLNEWKQVYMQVTFYFSPNAQDSAKTKKLQGNGKKTAVSTRPTEGTAAVDLSIYEPGTLFFIEGLEELGNPIQKGTFRAADTGNAFTGRYDKIDIWVQDRSRIHKLNKKYGARNGKMRLVPVHYLPPEKIAPLKCTRRR